MRHSISVQDFQIMNSLHSAFNLLSEIRSVINVHMLMNKSSSKAKKYNMNKIRNLFIAIELIEINITKIHRNINLLNEFKPLVYDDLMLQIGNKLCAYAFSN